ncbi:MerR family transcriptional regulator [Hymenobacter lutimineralis]|nr:MerR family transcriptional regulator [Hymenobacter lutimineralis]
MLISVLSQRAGLSRDTIRYYEREGLISVGRKERQPNNYKDYSEAMLRRLLAVKSLKGFGFTLREIQQLIDWWDADLFNCPEGKEQVQQKIGVIDEKIAQLQAVRLRLEASISNCPDDCAIQSTLQQL